MVLGEGIEGGWSVHLHTVDTRQDVLTPGEGDLTEAGWIWHCLQLG